MSDVITYVLLCLLDVLLLDLNHFLAGRGAARRLWAATVGSVTVAESGYGSARRVPTAARASDVRAHRAAKLPVEVLERVQETTK